MAVAVEHGPPGGHVRLRRRRGDQVGIVVDEHVRAGLDGVHPLRRGAHRHARDAVPVRLLLQPAGVGEDHARLRGERGELEVAERLDEADVRAELDPGLGERRAGARVGREDDRLLEPAQPLGDAAQARLRDVGLAVDGRDRVPAGLEAVERDAVARERRKQARRVGHHVADHLGPPRHALALELCARALVGAEEQRGELVDLDPVSLLGHRPVAGAQARLDVSHGPARLRAGQRAGEGGVRVAEDEHPVGPLGLDRHRDPRPHHRGVGGARGEPVARLLEAQLVEEDLRELAVVVLPRVEHDLLDRGRAEREREGRRLDELRPVPDDGEHLHPGQGRRSIGAGAMLALTPAGR